MGRNVVVAFQSSVLKLEVSQCVWIRISWRWSISKSSSIIISTALPTDKVLPSSHRPVFFNMHFFYILKPLSMYSPAYLAFIISALAQLTQRSDADGGSVVQ